MEILKGPSFPMLLLVGHHKQNIQQRSVGRRGENENHGRKIWDGGGGVIWPFGSSDRHWAVWKAEITGLVRQQQKGALSGSSVAFSLILLPPLSTSRSSLSCCSVISTLTAWCIWPWRCGQNNLSKQPELDGKHKTWSCHSWIQLEFCWNKECRFLALRPQPKKQNKQTSS